MYAKSRRIIIRTPLLTSHNQVSDSKAAYYVRAACLAAGFPPPLLLAASTASALPASRPSKTSPHRSRPVPSRSVSQ
jgi:hypothetical protein